MFARVRIGYCRNHQRTAHRVNHNFPLGTIHQSVILFLMVVPISFNSFMINKSYLAFITFMLYFLFMANRYYFWNMIYMFYSNNMAN